MDEINKYIIVAHKLSANTISEMNAILKPYKLNVHTYMILDYVSRRNKKVTLGEICKKSSMQHNSGLSKTAKSLNDLGMIIRRRDPDDERAIYITLTEHGRNVIRRANTAIIEKEKKISTNFKKQLKQLTEAAKKI